MKTNHVDGAINLVQCRSGFEDLGGPQQRISVPDEVDEVARCAYDDAGDEQCLDLQLPANQALIITEMRTIMA